MLEPTLCPIKHSDSIGLKFINTTPSKQEELGQYFTSEEVAIYMAQRLVLPKEDNIRLLDPGAGSGVLVASAIKHLAALDTKKRKTFSATLYEIDDKIITSLKKAMNFLKEWCSNNGISFSYTIKNEDYVLANSSALNDGLPLFKKEQFEIIISNPPYFKISKDDERAKCCSKLVHGQPNIYFLFMGVAASQLVSNGQIVFITPRSFSSGQYFKSFRKHFFEQIHLKQIHVFESRTNAFERDSVLQENIITYGIQGEPEDLNEILITSSNGKSDLGSSSKMKVEKSFIVDTTNDYSLRLPTNEEDLRLLKMINSWTNSLEKMELKISTGPIVPFRATEFLQKEEGQYSVPLLWVQHILPMKVKFPLEVFRKEQWFNHTSISEKQLVDDQNMILMRRFSPKEDFRRITVAPYEKKSLKHEKIGLENHLNYIYDSKKKFSKEEMYGLAGYLSSQLFDSYFRVINGNTQVSATELRAAPLPSKNIIAEIGDLILKTKAITHSSIDNIVECVIGFMDS